MPVVKVGIVENSMRPRFRLPAKAISILSLLCALQITPRLTAQVSCTVTYNCHGSSQCASLMGGPQTLSFASVSACTAQAATVGDGTIASCSCGSAASSKAPAAAPAGLNPVLTNAAQAIGTALGQRLAKALLGAGNNAPAPMDPANAALDAAQQQTALAAHQLNDSGIYLLKQRDYPGAINEFQKALALEPNDANIQYNLGFAKQAKKNAAVAGQTSGALGQLLGNDPAGMGSPGDALNLVNLGSGANYVNLRNATGTTIDPATLKGQLDTIFSKGAPISAPADAQELDKLFQPSQPAPSSLLQGKIDKLNAQCASVVPGSAADSACKQAQAAQERADQQQLDELFNGPPASGQNQAAAPPQP
jgi:tetratricopeptide (TPR) repeat protein